MSKLLEEMCPKIYDNPSYKAGLRQGRLEGLREGGDHVLKEMTKEDKIKEKVLESDLPFEIK